VDSTTGLQMAYLKQWAPRSHQPLALRMPEIVPGWGAASGLDALEAAARYPADLAYLDPPYNQHSYLGNYHVWESLVRWDKPEVYGVAMKRVDVRERPSAFNRRGSIEAAFRGVLASVRARWLLVSFNDEGHLGLDTVRGILGAEGELTELAVEHPRYIGHRIGIYNPQGQRVGAPGKARNHEHLFRVDRGPAVPVRKTRRAGAAGR
jgi:adenine-specific DNA-methyltransferase